MHSHTQAQPACSASSTLLYNGEIYNDETNESVESDTSQLLRGLDAACSSSNSKPFDSAAEWLLSLEAEYSFVFLHRGEQLWFAKDPVGRRSLLFGSLRISSACHEDLSPELQTILSQAVLLSSVALPGFQLHLPNQNVSVETVWCEIPPRGIFCMDLSSGEVSLAYDWSHSLFKRSAVIEAPLSEAAPVEQCLSLLSQAVYRRSNNRGHDHFFGVLFSGGLDSTVLAALADDLLPSNVTIELVNVSFGNTPAELNLASDRQAALRSYDELCQRSTKGRLQLKLIDVNSSELLLHFDHIRQLILPLDTLMDVSIAAPLWFAARGTGCGERKVNSRVLLMGSGADEQFGGYGRHRVCFKTGGYQALSKELQMDIDRIWHRNLGRDDRVVADNGREARFPFLDQDFSRWLCTVDLRLVCNMALPPGEGDKFLLRNIAKQLQLHTAANLVKRAVQFGSRLTKMMPKGKGTDKLDE